MKNKTSINHFIKIINLVAKNCPVGRNGLTNKNSPIFLSQSKLFFWPLKVLEDRKRLKEASDVKRALLEEAKMFQEFRTQVQEMKVRVFFLTNQDALIFLLSNQDYSNFVVDQSICSKLFLTNQDDSSFCSLLII